MLAISRPVIAKIAMVMLAVCLDASVRKAFSQSVSNESPALSSPTTTLLVSESTISRTALRPKGQRQNEETDSTVRSQDGTVRLSDSMPESDDDVSMQDEDSLDSNLSESDLTDSEPQSANSYREDFDPSIPDYLDLDLDSNYAIPQGLIFGPGFQIQSADEQFRLQIHYESQIESRIWTPEDQLPTNSGFFLPRQRFFFAGNIIKFTDYELAINRGVNNINLLNAFLNFHFDDRVNIRVGRFFTPLFYDQYAVSNYWLPTPERSLFTTNLSTNRQIGAMAWGYLFDKRPDYAA